MPGPVGSPGKNRTLVTMACRKRRLLLGPPLFLGLISHLLVPSSIIVYLVLSKCSLNPAVGYCGLHKLPPPPPWWEPRAVEVSLFLNLEKEYCLALQHDLPVARASSLLIFCLSSSFYFIRDCAVSGTVKRL